MNSVVEASTDTDDPATEITAGFRQLENPQRETREVDVLSLVAISSRQYYQRVFDLRRDHSGITLIRAPVYSRMPSIRDSRRTSETFGHSTADLMLDSVPHVNSENHTLGDTLQDSNSNSWQISIEKK